MGNALKEQFKYKCPNCGGVIKRYSEIAKCSKCSKTLPIENGAIIFESIDYWGEMVSNELNNLINAASSKGWKVAVEEFYKGKDERLFISIADFNRANWTSILPIPYESIVLDISSGMGAITHSVANNYQKIISMEAITQRVKFATIRMKQEQLDNVEIIQSTVKNMPFFDESFDLIILNGVLEWVGEWDTSATPDEIQYRILSKVLRFLKPNGIVIIGIENRIGYNLFFGGMDHSGIGFTSLMPRKIASIYLKYKSPRHHRNIEKKKTDYRTYTYSRKGYNKLLERAGFNDISFYYPDPGYNQPYNIIPIGNKLLMKEFNMSSFNSSIYIYGYNFLRRIKKLFIQIGLMNELVPDFLIVGKKSTSESKKTDNLEDSVISNILDEIMNLFKVKTNTSLPFSLYTRPFINKRVITVYNTSGAVKLAVAKISNTQRVNPYYAKEEFETLKKMHNFSRKYKEFSASIPKPLFSKEIKHNIITIESAINGERFHDRLMKKGYYKDKKNVDNDLKRITLWLLKFYRIGAKYGNQEFREINSEFYEIPDSIINIIETDKIKNEDVLLFPQHGDYFSKNIFFLGNQIGVIDWEHTAYGYPPLFDYFCLISSLNFVNDSREDDFQLNTFKSTFFSKNWLTDLVLKYVMEIVSDLGLDERKIPLYFFKYLLVRYNSFVLETDKRDYRLGDFFKKQLEYYVKNQSYFIAKEPI